MKPWKVARKFSKGRDRVGRFSTDASRSESRRADAGESAGALQLVVEIGPPPATDDSAKWGKLADKVLGPPEESPQPDIDFERWVRSA
jgi:hypothetical protein